MRRLLFLLLLGVAGATLIRTYFYEGIYIASNSMAPTLPEGTHLMVNKFALLFRKPNRGEIIMFKTPQSSRKGLVKRVIAIENDVVEIKEKAVYLNGQMLAEPYVQHSEKEARLMDDTLPSIRVPEGYVFVMGDHRDVSNDSRDWRMLTGEWVPYVPLSMVLGVIKDPSR